LVFKSLPVPTYEGNIEGKSWLLAWHFTRTSCSSLQTMKHLHSHKNWEVDWAGTEATFFHWSSLPTLWSLYTSTDHGNQFNLTP
jgi:hypothetical protein